MPGYVISDFGDFNRTPGNTGAEDDPDLDRVGVKMQIFRAFAQGYIAATTDFLTPIEKELLPFGAKLLTYMQTVRFLTDYLDGDHYYKIAYPEHNRQRSLAQFRLLQRIEEREEGCLSVPGLYAPVKRPVSIVFQAQILGGREIRLECGGLLARAIQHEYDHLDGIVFVQRLEDEDLNAIKSGIDKIVKKSGKRNFKINRVKQ